MAKGSKSATSLAVGAFTAALLAGSTAPAAAEQQPVHNHVMGESLKAHDARGKPQPIDKRAARLGSSVSGIDVASYQGNVDWSAQHKAGKRFVWVKATENTNYTNPYFNQQYNGSRAKGLIRGAYHFASPNTSSGTTQAKYFLAHGGGWTGDGKTLPGALDLESTKGQPTCYGLSKAKLGKWIKDFSNTYHAKTNKYPAIYTSANWWNKCVSGDFSKTNPLWVARYSSSPGALPGAWGSYSVWQHGSSPMDQNVFNGSLSQLRKFAKNAD